VAVVRRFLLAGLLACAEAPAATPAAMAAAAYDDWRRPEALVAALELEPGQRVADVGAGDGYLTWRLAAAVGPGGRVTATDVDPRALVRLATDARRTATVDVRAAPPERSGLEAGSYHRIVLAQVDHLLPDRAGYLRELAGALAPGGRIAVSNRLQHRAALESAAAAAGLSARASAVDLPGQFLLFLERP
jgi:predicted methyltransferase